MTSSKAKKAPPAGGTAHKKPWIFVGLGAAVLLASVALVWGILSSGPAQVGSVNGHPVTLEEFQLYADQARSDVINAFYKEHQADSNAKDFWDTPYGGQTPRERLIETVKETILTVKMEQEEAIAHGLPALLDFESLKKALDAENKDRRAKQQNGEAIYGPDQYSMMQFLSYKRTALTDDLKTALLETELKPTEEQLLQAYNSLEPLILDKGYEGTIVRFFCTDPTRADELFGEVKRLVQEGLTAEEIEPVITEAYGDLFLIKTSEVSPDTHREDTDLLALYDACRNLEEGQFLAPYDVVGTGVELDFMLEKNDLGKMTMEEAGDFPQTKWINEQFGPYIAQKAAQAKVTWDDSALRRVTLS